jgi:hypothetical protein
MKYRIVMLFSMITWNAFSQSITVTVDAQQGIIPISPWIYGRNNNTSDNPSNPVSAADWQLYKDANLRMYRENGGNNSTKYNWRLKLSSHPDWYCNVYDHNWNYSASTLLANTTNTQGLYAFQLLGKAASSKTHNFSDYNYTQANGNINTTKNWAGGGGPVAYGGNGGNGNTALYLEDWTADSTAGILNHWFNTLGYDSDRFIYWNMDNEPEAWSGTHDDVLTSTITAEQYMQKYFAVAKKVRQKFPNVKLLGPVCTNEWQWYNWNNSKVTEIGTGLKYSWIEYFIKRIGEEQAATGIRLLDVLDFHFYPNTASNTDLTLQLHRVWFDTQWDYPNANGVKVVGPNDWNNTNTKEYLFERCNQWLNQYLGASHNVKFSLSEYGQIANNGSENTNVIACWYASHLGTFANHGVELFTPWDWYAGQWEVMHLFSNYFGVFSTTASSSNEAVLSGYSSLSADGDSLMIVVVNRDKVNSRTVDMSLQNFLPSATTVNGFELSGLPTGTETFVSKSNNALQSKQFTITGSSLSFTVPKLSVTLIQIPTSQPIAMPTGSLQPYSEKASVRIYPNPSKGKFNIRDIAGEYTITILDLLGKPIETLSFTGEGQIDLSSYNNGNYIIQIRQNNQLITRKIVKD